MVHLAQVTREMRLSLKVGGVVFTVFLLLFFSFKGYGLLKSVFFPDPPPPPEQGFGPLEPIQFPQSPQLVPSSYTINTVDGALPADIPDRMNVYVLATPSASLLALQNAKTAVSQLDFTSQELKITDTVYQWFNNELGESIIYDIVTKNFKIDSDLVSNISSVTTNLQDEAKVGGAAFGLLASLNANLSDIDQTKQQVIYLRYDGEKFIEAEKKSDAQLARVNLFQKSLGQVQIQKTKRNLDIYYPYPDRTLMTFVVNQQPNKKLKVISADFVHKPVVAQNYSTYPIKTPQIAFEDLQRGNGYIVKNPTNQLSAQITEVILGYYIGKDLGFNELGQEEKYVLPIYVFKGSNNFMAYVSALSHATPTVGVPN